MLRMAMTVLGSLALSVMVCFTTGDLEVKSQSASGFSGGPSEPTSKQLQARFPDLFNHLVASPYHGMFDSKKALREFHKRPVDEVSRIAYLSMIEAFKFHVGKIPKDCQTIIFLYEGNPRQEKENLGYVSWIALDDFLRMRTALVEGILEDYISASDKEAAIRNMEKATILFSRDDLLRKLATYAATSKPAAHNVRSFVDLVRRSPARLRKRGTSEPCEFEE